MLCFMIYFAVCCTLVKCLVQQIIKRTSTHLDVGARVNIILKQMMQRCDFIVEKTDLTTLILTDMRREKKK